MTPTEFEASWVHLARYPPMEVIMCALYMIVAKIGGAKDAKASDFGYWLESPALREDRLQLERAAERALKAQMTREAYRG